MAEFPISQLNACLDGIPVIAFNAVSDVTMFLKTSACAARH
jgi:hypothetical protein